MYFIGASFVLLALAVRPLSHPNDEREGPEIDISGDRAARGQPEGG
jgi:hypothetical protein